MTATAASMSASDILANARSLADSIRSRDLAAEYDRIRRLPPDIVEEIRAAGIMRMNMPKIWGGPEMTSMEQVEVIEALARADASVAMGQGALVARAQADLVVVSNRLADITAARATAQRALRIGHQNLAWAAVYNAACIPAALAGWLPPWAAGLGMACSSLAVVLNALRAGRPPVVTASGV